MANHLRITAGGWETFTGNFGGVDFVDGLSVDVVNRHQIDHLSGLVRCDLADASGALIGQGGIAARLVGGVNVSESPTALRKATQDELDADRRQSAAESGKAPTKMFTQEELETIAAKEGLTGLRKIGDAWSVRDRAINKLINLILKAQNAFNATVNARNSLVAESRAKAARDQIDRHLAREAAIDAKARLAGTVSGVSNAIGPNGENVTMPTPTIAPLGPVTSGVVKIDPNVVVVTQTVDVASVLATPIVEPATPEIHVTPAASDAAPAVVSVDVTASALAHLVEAGEAMHASPEQIVAAAEIIKTDMGT